MTLKEFNKHFNVSRETISCLSLYESLLKKWNKKTNLVSKNSLSDAWGRHFLDSAQLVKHCQPENKLWLDFGSGAGFPGLVLAIMGKKNIHLIEADQKKCVFLKEIAMLTDTNITIHNCRIENLSFINVDLITCRALAPLNKLVDYVETFVSKSSDKKQTFPKLLFLKGKNYKNELLQLRKNRNIDFKEYPSITDKDGKILYINKVDVL